MGTFTRSGQFRDRASFLEALRGKLAKLRDGVLRGFDERWEEGEPTRATLSGMGARVSFSVGASEWTCTADLPAWIPLPQASIEDKFDREFSDLKGL